MKKELIQQLYSAFEQAALEVDGVECWSARELRKKLVKKQRILEN